MIMPCDLVLTGLATEAMSYIEFLACVIYFAECSNISKNCDTSSLWKRNVVFCFVLRVSHTVVMYK